MDAELRRLRKNLREKIRYYNKRGYNIDPYFVKNLTLEELQYLTTQQLLGEVNEEQQEKQDLLAEYDIFPKDIDMIIQQFRDDYDGFNTDAQALLETWLQRIIDERGIEAVAIMINEAKSMGLEITNKVIYGDLIGFTVEMLKYLPIGYEYNDNEFGGIKEDLTDALMESLELQFDTNPFMGY